MDEFQEVLKVTDRLLGPEGCPWDQLQTMKSTRPCIIEEASELVDAIDLEDNHHIEEELGDMLFVVIFLCRLAEKEKRCSLNEVLKKLKDKLIRRHPHVFGDVKINSFDEFYTQWDSIKQQEKGKEHRKSALDSIPKGLPALAKAQKMHKKIHKTSFEDTPKIENEEFQNEDSLGTTLWNIIAIAQEKGLDAEHALRNKLSAIEKSFREFETKNQ